MITLKSTVSQMQKSHGVNRDVGMFFSDDISGDYQRCDAPEGWEDILIEASCNTHGMTPLTLADLGEKSDWIWWSLDEDRDGYLTGVSYLVAQWADDSSAVEEDKDWEWDETNPETTAEKVAAIMGNDGSVWETNDGRQTLADVCQEHGGTAEQEEHDDPTMVPNRIVFPDGSAICYSDSGWDIEGSRPYLMQGLE